MRNLSADSTPSAAEEFNGPLWIPADDNVNITWDLSKCKNYEDLSSLCLMSVHSTSHKTILAGFPTQHASHQLQEGF